jgi:hypothetical protein
MIFLTIKYITLQPKLKIMITPITPMMIVALQKVDEYTDSMIEDIQDVLRVEFDNGLDFSAGVLPPRYKEIKEELKQIFLKYLADNMVLKPAEVQ